MRPFHLDSGMKTMRGVFYPTGWMVLMFPGEQQARDAARILADKGIAEGDVMHASPTEFRREVLGATGDDNIIPSAGTEGDTVRRLSELAAQGHHALLVHAPEHKDSEQILQWLSGSGIAYGQKYRKLVIEDVEV